MRIQQMFLGLGSKSESEETISSTTTDLVLATLFGNDWTADIPKILNIDSGVTVGGTSGNAAILVSTGLVNTLVINNSGTITGHGGAAGAASGSGTSNSGTPGGDGGDGGTGISVVSAGDGVTVNNTGTISGGGGGGGGGGAGERGRVYYGHPINSYINVSGRSGGAGGVGAGYNQSATSGTNGQTGNTSNSGNGGNGGDGGALGTAGSNGGTGGYTSSAPRTPGAGGSGGAAGVAIKNDGATWTNSGGGTYNGAYT